MAFVDTSITLDKLPSGESRCVEVGSLQIGFFRNAEGLFALDNLCPHRGAPLHEGFVTDGVVSCPWHQWQFQLKDGVCRNIPKVAVTSYPVEVRGEAIWIDVDKAKGVTP